MIAGNAANLAAGLPCAGGGDHAGAVGAAVDQIAEKDHGGIGRFGFRIIRLDRVDQSAKQVQPAMDIANRVNALALRQGGCGPGRRGAEKFAKKREHRSGCDIRAVLHPHKAFTRKGNSLRKRNTNYRGLRLVRRSKARQQ